MVATAYVPQKSTLCACINLYKYAESVQPQQVGFDWPRIIITMSWKAATACTCMHIYVHKPAHAWTHTTLINFSIATCTGFSAL